MSHLRSVPLFAFLAVLGIATAAPAAVCLLDDNNDVVYRFSKLKLPKRVGDSAPVSGFGLFSGIEFAMPVGGAITRQDEAVWAIGLTRYVSGCLISGSLNLDFSGAFLYDCDFDGDFDETVTIARVECPAP